MYFTKYLNVECPQMAKQPEGSGCNKNNACTFPNCQVALFLCSRDVQVGDKIEGLTVINKYLNITSKEEVFGSFKMIGQISPEAVWVKEGGLKDDEVQFVVSESPPFEGWVGVELGQWMSWKNFKAIQIKCPTCGGFH